MYNTVCMFTKPSLSCLFTFYTIPIFPFFNSQNFIFIFLYIYMLYMRLLGLEIGLVQVVSDSPCIVNSFDAEVLQFKRPNASSMNKT